MFDTKIKSGILNLSLIFRNENRCNQIKNFCDILEDENLKSKIFQKMSQLYLQFCFVPEFFLDVKKQGDGYSSQTDTNYLPNKLCLDD